MRFHHVVLAALCGLAALIGAGRSAVPAVAQAPAYNYFPSPAADDGRMLALAGIPFRTQAGNSMDFRVAVPAGSSSFEIGIFDGDTNGGPPSLDNPDFINGSWDTGDSQVEFVLFADPDADGSGSVEVGRWNGSGMPDNDWFSINLPTSSTALSQSGHYFYTLRATLLDPTSNTQSAFKLRTTGYLSLRPLSFGYMVPQAGGDEFYVIYPDLLTAPNWSDPNLYLTTRTTYDGTWAFFLDVPTDQSLFEVWEGDFDHGSGSGTELIGWPSAQAIADAKDTDDPDTAPGALPPGHVRYNEQDEAAQGPGDPLDDHYYDFWRRDPSIKYSVTDPTGRIYANNNPSGNLEWESFKISNNPNTTRSDVDYSPSVSSDGATTVPATGLLPKGAWRIDVTGQDVQNLCFWRFTRYALGVDPNGNPNPPLRPFRTGNTVFRDYNNNGIYEPAGGDVPIPGVVVYLRNEADGSLLSATTNAQGQVGYDIEAGGYTMYVPQSNFSPGRPLAGLSSTTGDNVQTDSFPDTDGATYTPFGYNTGGNNSSFSLAGTVWFDANANAAQETSEGGIAGVLIRLYDGSGALIGSTNTDGVGDYAFANLPAGTYRVEVVSTTLPANLSATFDYDGIQTLHVATVTIGPGVVVPGINFGYTTTGTPGGGGSNTSSPFTTFTQGGWGSTPSGFNPGTLLENNFTSRFPNGLVVGGIRTLTFTSAAAVRKFLPQGGTAGMLKRSYVNPSKKTEAGVLAGQITALQLNVSFSDAGITRSGLGDLTITTGPFTGVSVNDLLSIGRAVLGGNASALPPGVTISQLNDAASAVNENFVDGTTDRGYLR